MTGAVHHMHLSNDYYDALKRGPKDIEVRLFDKKRQQLEIGDIIEFSNREKPELPPLRVTIMDLLRYPTFASLVEAVPIARISANHQGKTDWLKSVYEIYSRQDEQRQGVLGIRVRVIAT